MHSLLIQCLIARIDRDFSPEQYKELLDQADKELGYAGMIEFWNIHNQIGQVYKGLNERFKRTPAPRHRDIVKQVVGEAIPPPPVVVPEEEEVRSIRATIVRQG